MKEFITTGNKVSIIDAADKVFEESKYATALKFPKMLLEK